MVHQQLLSAVGDGYGDGSYVPFMEAERKLHEEDYLNQEGGTGLGLLSAKRSPAIPITTPER